MHFVLHLHVGLNIDGLLIIHGANIDGVAVKAVPGEVSFLLGFEFGLAHGGGRSRGFVGPVHLQVGFFEGVAIDGFELVFGVLELLGDFAFPEDLDLLGLLRLEEVSGLAGDVVDGDDGPLLVLGLALDLLLGELEGGLGPGVGVVEVGVHEGPGHLRVAIELVLLRDVEWRLLIERGGGVGHVARFLKELGEEWSTFSAFWIRSW